jgi:hypothetical protein
MVVGTITINMPFVSIIITNWNGCSDLVNCLVSVKGLDYPAYEIIVVDNASTDGSQETVKARFPEVKLIENKENSGNAEGINIGIRKAMEGKPDYVLILDNDVKVEKKILSELVKMAETDPKIGIVGPKIYYFDSNKISFAGGKLDWLEGAVHIGDGRIDNGEYDEKKDVIFITGCAILARKEVIKKIGLFNGDFFAYYEDVDFCLRAKKAGYRIVYSPTAVMWHKVGATANRARSKISAFQLYLGTRNKIISVKDNYMPLSYGWFLMKQVLIFSPIYLVSLFLRGQYSLACAYSNGLLDGVRRELSKEKFMDTLR